MASNHQYPVIRAQKPCFSQLDAIRCDTQTLSSIQRPKPMIAIRRVPLREVAAKDHWRYLRKNRFKFVYKIFLNLNFWTTWVKEKLKRISTLLKNLKSFLQLAISFCPDSKEETKVVLQSLKQPIGFSSLSIILSKRSLHHQFHQEINTPTAFKFSPLLHTLILDVSGYYHATNELLQNLFSSFRSLIDLSTLKINFCGCTNVTNKTVKSLCNSLGHLKKISTLNLNFAFCNKINNKGLKSLTTRLRRLPLLYNLNLNFLQCPNITHEAIKSLFACLDQLKSIHILYLNFPHCQGLTNKDLEYVSQYLGSQTSLTHLYLKIPISEAKGVNKEGIKSLSAVIKRIGTLSMARLNDVSVVYSNSGFK